MYEGEVIKFYRKKARLTQDQLCEGICSTTHISKIERGLTEYSPEITTLLANRLEIDIDEEVKSLKNIKAKLDKWHEMIISQNMEEAAKIHEELNKNDLIKLSEYEMRYKLLFIKHHLKNQELHKVHNAIKKLTKGPEDLPVFEQNLYNHVLGIYNIAIENHLKAIKLLKNIDLERYSNALVYYDIATAYHYNNSPVMSYHYAAKALQLYKQTNNFLGVIDTENLMIIQIESDQHRDFNETTRQYEDLLKICDLCNSPDKTAKLLHNFAYENLRRKKYQKSKQLYEQSLKLKKAYSTIYLLSLEGYIKSSYDGGLLSEEELLHDVFKGLDIAKTIKNKLYEIVFSLHKYIILKRSNQYHQYLANKAIPYFKEHGYIALAQKYERELFNYYTGNGENDKALEVADDLVNNQNQ
ncbi:helix-turn-helix domain-containing protein [Virgibacillus siamensis]|uniref:helix-turn-helix domain-containing protein n=1 Tax=Virgibacillus siamensis TaxID=480071 RepID=UPI00158AE974|nr:helix-turn-helix transcriptional regulator [Virgibacillus siamensis]